MNGRVAVLLSALSVWLHSSGKCLLCPFNTAEACFLNRSAVSTDWSLQSRFSPAIILLPQQEPSVTLRVLTDGWLIQITGNFKTAL